MDICWALSKLPTHRKRTYNRTMDSNRPTCASHHPLVRSDAETVKHPEVMIDSIMQAGNGLNGVPEFLYWPVY